MEVGPPLPPELLQQRKNSNVNSKQQPEETKAEIGMELPPHLKALREQKLQKSEEVPTRRVVGPSLDDLVQEKTERSDSEDDDIGPKLPSVGDHKEEAPTEEEIEAKRRRDAEQWKKLRNTGDSASEKGGSGRESWMTELPEKDLFKDMLNPQSARSASAGVGGRKGLGSSNVVDKSQIDTSAWTDTPQDRERKRKERDESRHGDRKAEKKKKLEYKKNNDDAQIEENIRKFNEKNRSKSLLEMHNEKLEKEKKEKAKKGPVLYKPWDKEKEFTNYKMDANKRKEVLLDANKLSGRFSSSSRSQFT